MKYTILYYIIFFFISQKKKKKKEISRAGLCGFTSAGIKSSYIVDLQQ